MEYVPGPSLETLREQRGRLPWPEVLDLAIQIAPALKHAHDRGVIHRDLKPSNLLRTLANPEGEERFGRVKLTDFGIASLFASQHLTVTGGVVGTAEYLSPEQAAGKPVTGRSDLYSFGVVLYTLLTGRTPFEGEVMDLLHKHRFAQFDRPARIVPEVPADFDMIVCQLLEKDPAQRPGDGGVLHRRLESLRRKMDRKAAEPHAEVLTSLTQMDAEVARDSRRAGPATIMSRLMRKELKEQQLGGPVRQWFNQPWVLITLFLITLGLIIWFLWPLSAETLFERAATLMATSEPDNWERAWDQYLEPLERRFPDHPHQAEVKEYRQRLADYQAERQASRTARHAGPMGEGQWFYQEGLRRRQQKDEAGARRIWKGLVAAFENVPAERPWVRLANKELEEAQGEEAPSRQWDSVRAARKRILELQQAGEPEKAAAIDKALAELYRDDPAAQAILKEKD
jgi:serine/threonine-protein kinase